MKRLLFILLIAAAGNLQAQITVDTSRTIVTVKEKIGVSVRTLTIFKSFVPGTGVRNQIVYQPMPDDFGVEPETLRLTFADEVPHIKAMFDAALKRRKYDCSRVSINILPYTDLLTKLTDIYVNSPEWNNYLKTATNLRTTVTLYDGNEVAVVAYDVKVAAAVLDKSDFLKDFNALFAPYGYVVTSGGFAEEHQQALSADKLILIGRNGNLFVPLPNSSFTLTKIKR